VSDWTSFFAFTGGSSATLLGLLFVALSVSIQRQVPGLRSQTMRLIQQAFRSFMATLMISGVMLMPRLSASTTGEIVLALVVTALIWGAVRFVLAARTFAIDPRQPGEVRRHATSLIGYALVSVAATRSFLGEVDSIALLAAGVLVLLGSAATISWDIMLSLIGERWDREDDVQP
jgi:small-conductance mechanosensitive channel